MGRSLRKAGWRVRGSVRAKRGWGMVAVLGLFCTSACALERAEVREWLQQGHAYFKQANEQATSDPDAARDLYRKAVLRFERVVDEGGIENGKLYYNIGNAYFRMGDIGRAILNYKRARRYRPNDANLEQNLHYARARRVDVIEERQQTRILKTLFFWHYDVPSHSRATLFLIGFVCLWSLAGVRLFVRHVAIGRLLVLCGLLAVLTGGSLAVEAMQERWVRPGVILAQEVVARKGDSEAYERSFTDPLHAGTEFVLVEDRGDWYHIELTDGRRCWVPASKVEMVR